MAGKGLVFLDQVSRIIWDGSVDHWDQPPHLTDAMIRAGLDPETQETDVATDPNTYDDAIEENQAAHRGAGHWGVPLMVFENEPFYGQDRIDLMVWRMRPKGI